MVEVCALTGGCELRSARGPTPRRLRSCELGSARLDSAVVGTVVRTVERGRVSERGRRTYIRWFGRVCVALAAGAVRHDDGEGYCEWKTRPCLAGWLGGRRRGSVTAVRWRSRNSPARHGTARLARVGQRRGVRAPSVSLSRTTPDASVRDSAAYTCTYTVGRSARTYLPRESPSAPRLADMAS